MNNFALKFQWVPDTKLEQAFMEALPDKPYMSNDKTASLIRPKSWAHGFDYIQPNKPNSVKFIVIDCDIAGQQTAWIEKNLPAPNFIVSTTPEVGFFLNTTCHYYYMLDSEVFTKGNVRSRPIQFLKAIKLALNKELCGDLGYSGLMAKNPLSSTWDVKQARQPPYSLNELARYLELELVPFKANDNKLIRENEGRNIELFDRLRYWAYKTKREYEDLNFTTWSNAVLDQAEDIFSHPEFQHFNPDKKPYTYKEVITTAKSVAKWVWYRYRGSDLNRGVMELSNSNLSIKQKQKLSGPWSAAQRVRKSILKIQKTFNELRLSRKRPTQVNVAILSGLGLSTVKRHWKAISNDYRVLLEQSKIKKITKETGFLRKGFRRCQSDVSPCGVASFIHTKSVPLNNGTLNPVLFLKNCKT